MNLLRTSNALNRDIIYFIASGASCFNLQSLMRIIGKTVSIRCVPNAVMGIIWMAEINSATTGRDYREGIQLFEPESEERPEAETQGELVSSPFFPFQGEYHGNTNT